jgi:hypothetical protein
MSTPPKEVGDVDHIKVFANEEAADEWFKENDPEGVAFDYEALKLPMRVSRTILRFEKTSPQRPCISGVVKMLVHKIEYEESNHRGHCNSHVGMDHG